MTEQASNVRRIVVGVDLTETGDHALRQGLELAQQVEPSELHVTYVIRTERDVSAKKLEGLAEEMQKKLDDVRAHVQLACTPTASEGPFTQDIVFHVRLGAPAQALHQVAIDIDADMLVVGTNARKGMEKLLLGSVAEELVRMARLPVVIAHPKALRGLRVSDRPEPRREGEDLQTHAVTHRARIEFVPRTSHISGLL